MGFIGQTLSNEISGASKAPKQAAQIEAQASDRAVAEQQRQYNQTRADQMPWLNTGRQALNMLGGVMGFAQQGEQGQPLSYEDWASANATTQTINAQPSAVRQDPSNLHTNPRSPISINPVRSESKTITTPGSVEDYQKYLQTFGTGSTQATAPDYSAFYKSPGYQFRLEEGQKAGQNQFAARGGAYSGNALKALADYNQNMASNEYGNWWNQLAGLAGVGQASANTLAGVGQSTANNIGNFMQQGAQSRASGLIGSAAVQRNAYNQAMQNDAQNFGTFASFFFGGRGG